MAIPEIPIETRMRFQKRALQSVPGISKLIKLESEDGEIKYRTLFDGKVHTKIDDAIDSISTIGINLYSSFGPGDIDTPRGLAQFASEASTISKGLKSLTKIQKETIHKLGLDFLIDQDITIEHLKYSHNKKKEVIEKIRTTHAQTAGVINLTDEGATVVNYKLGNRVLSSDQAKQMKYVLGIGTLTDSFVDSILGSDGLPDFSGFAKVGKRKQGMISDRQVVLSGERLENFVTPNGKTISLLSPTGKGNQLSGVYEFDDVSSFFRALFTDTSDLKTFGKAVTQTERFLLAHGMGFNEEEIEKIAKNNPKLIKEFQQRLRKEFNELYRLGETGEQDFEIIKKMFTEKYKGDFSKFKKGMQQLAKEEGDQGNMARKLMATIGGVEKMRDGEMVANVNSLDQFIKSIREEREAFISSKVQLTAEDYKIVQRMDNEIEALLHAKANGLEGLDSVTARIHGAGIQGKGELFFRRFGKYLPKELRDKMFVISKSAMKREIQGVPSIDLDIAMSHKANVYVDPLMLLYQEDYFGSEQFMRATQANVEKQMKGIQSFIETGFLPEDVKQQIFGGIEKEAKVDNKIYAKLDAGAKAAYMRNREEARTIQRLLQSGVDPRRIPELLRRVNDYYATNAFRVKGERVDLAMPDTMRLALRTEKSAYSIDDTLDLYGRVKVQGDDAINLVKFRVRGERLLTNGTAAALYHHSLGGFDLDDKGVPTMTTFKDAQGNDRLAFMTLRQPTGFQERVFQQADLADEQTLRKILEYSSGDFKSLLNDPDVMRSVSDPKEQRIVNLLKQAVNEKGNLDFNGITSDDVEVLLMKLRNSFGQKYGFSELMQMTNRDILEMVKSQSASALGLDKIFEGQEYTDFLAQRGIKADKIPDYTRGNFVNIIKKEYTDIKESEIVDEFNRLHGTNHKTVFAIERAGSVLSGADKEYFNVNYRTAIQTVEEKLQFKAAEQMGRANNLGLYINRQGVAMSMTSQIEDILDSMEAKGIRVKGAENLENYTLRNYYRSKYSFAVTDPSSAVDLSKALLSKLEIEEGLMVKAAIAVDELAQSGQITQEALEAALRPILGKDLNLGLLGESALQQTGRGVGFIRAGQIAEGSYGADELIGVDRALIESDQYGRLTGQQDQKLFVQSFLQEVREYRDQLENETEKQRLSAYLKEFEGKTTQEQLESLYLKPTSRYAVTGRLAEASMAAQRQEAALRRAGIRNAIAYQDLITPQARYMSQIEAIIDSQDDNIRSMIGLATEETDAAQFKAALKNSELTNEIYRSLSAMGDSIENINMLDAYDTLEAELISRYGTKESAKVLNSSYILNEMIENFTQLRDAALTRRAARLALRNYSVDDFEKIASDARTFGFEPPIATTGEVLDDRSLLNAITRDQAQEFVNLRRLMVADTGLSLTELGESQDLFDFMKLKTETLSIGETFYDSEKIGEGARNVFNFLEAEKRLAQLNDLNTAEVIASGDQITDEARRVIQTAEDTDGFIDAARTSYKRFSEFLKDGSFKNLFEDKLIRRSTFAIAGLAAFGFVYSARKDRTQEEIMGPPLLPGGSAYESDYPKNLPSISDLKYLNPTVAGMQYKINVMGSQQEIEKMQYLANGVIDGPVDSTIYNSLPRLGRDPYSDVASRF